MLSELMKTTQNTYCANVMLLLGLWRQLKDSDKRRTEYEQFAVCQTQLYLSSIQSPIMWILLNTLWICTHLFNSTTTTPVKATNILLWCLAVAFFKLSANILSGYRRNGLGGGWEWPFINAILVTSLLCLKPFNGYVGFLWGIHS